MPKLTAKKEAPSRLALQPKAPIAFTVGQRLTGYWPTLNKNNTLAEYRNQVERTRQLCEVERVLQVRDTEYDDMTQNFMVAAKCTAYGEGGTNSDADLPDAWQFFGENTTNAERDLFKRHAYSLVTVLTAPNRAPILIDRQGYDYARYVGFLS